MTKSSLVQLIAKKIQSPKNKAEQFVDSVFECMEDSLHQGRRIEIRGFGSFEVRSYKSYKGRNPRTGTVVHVKPKKLPFFKVGKELREKMNTKGSAKGGARKTRKD